ncbi:MAG: response regulator [bacterium]|nr:response regulator [bacterium]
MSQSEKNDAPPAAKPKGLIVDRKFKPEDLKIPRNQIYVRDLGQIFKLFQKWGYDIVWVEDGVDALKAIKLYKDDLKCVVVEAFIPGSGFTVARLIRFKPDCKHLPVFLMSSQLGASDLKESKRIGISACLERPFNDIAKLETSIQKGVDAGTGVTIIKEDPKTHIIRELERITGLPAMPTVYGEIEKLSKDPDATSEAYSHVIELDPGITTQMLKLCNSSAFSFSRRISSILDAVNLLGLQTVVDFVRTLSVVGAFKGSAPAFDTQEFWKHSIACGVSAKLLLERPEFSKTLKVGGDDPFMAGMVHDIGKQVLGFFFNEMYTMVLDEMQKNGQTMYDVEQDVLGLSHGDIGEALATKWQLPDILSKVIGLHHTPGATDTMPDMVHLIHLADICGKRTGFALAERHSQAEPDASSLAKLDMDLETLLGIYKEIESKVRGQVTDTFAAIFS